MRPITLVQSPKKSPSSSSFASPTSSKNGSGGKPKLRLGGIFGRSGRSPASPTASATATTTSSSIGMQSSIASLNLDPETDETTTTTTTPSFQLFDSKTNIEYLENEDAIAAHAYGVYGTHRPQRRIPSNSTKSGYDFDRLLA